jgi:hypothetical protein
MGLGRSVRRRLGRVLNDADRYVQRLNNRFADPSGKRAPHSTAPAPAKPVDVSVVKSLATGTRGPGE